MTGAPPPPPGRCWTVHGAAGPVDVLVQAPDHADLAGVRAALTAAGLPADQLWWGSTPLPDAVRLDDPRLRHGAALGSGAPGPAPAEPGGALELQVCAGPGAGLSRPLEHGRLVVGRGSGADDDAPGARLRLPDPEVSRAHLEVAVDGSGVTVRDLGSVNGTRWQVGGSAADPVGDHPLPWPLGATVRVGATSLRLAAPGGPARPARRVAGGRLVLDPSPSRPAPDPDDVVVAVPDEPPPPPRRAPAWVAIVLPAVAGVVLATVLSAPHYLLFALLGPLVALGTWVSDRWSGRRGHRRRQQDHVLALAGADAEVAAAVGAEVVHREAAAPDVAVLAGAARWRTGQLWGAAAGALPVRLGVGPGATRVVRGAGPPVRADLVPVVLDLGVAGLQLVGPRSPVLGVARSVLCQLAALHPPGRLAVTVLAAPADLPDWGWTRWLPHGGAGPGSAGPAGAGPGSTAPGSTAPGSAGAQHLVVVDGEPDGPRSAWLRRARSAGAVVLALGGPAATATPELTVLGGTGGRLVLPGRAPQPVHLDLVDADVAARVAADLAPLTVRAGSGGIPDQVRWRDLVGGQAPPWSRSRSRLTAALGVGADGPVLLDLCAAGPHALVAGTTGSGKSELLRTLVLGLAHAHPPDRCSFLLVDYKGGAAFAQAADLPHTVGVLTDLDGAATARALRSLGAELTRRERLLAEHGARELAELPDDVLLPRLVIVVDEFATLGDELPGFVPGLVGIAQRGRSLGVHLVLATQRPSGSVSPEIRANCTVRLCLRTTDEAGSRDVLGVPDAARLPVDRPGRALLRVGADAPVTVQVARVGTPAPTDGTTAGVVAEVVARRWSWPHPPAPPPAAVADGPTDLSVAVTRLRALAAPLPAPPRPWLPPLPDHLAPQRPVDGTPPTVLTWGLVDRPATQRQEPLVLDLAAGGGWLVLGGPGSGRTTALRTLLAAAVGQLTPHQVHVHVVDHAGGALGRCAELLPHTGTVVARGDGHRLHRLLVRLQEEVDRRRREPGPHPPLLLLVDGLDAVVEAVEELLPGTGIGALLRVLREGAAVGLTAVLTADRVLPGSRLAGAAGHRVVLPLADRADYPLAGVPVALVPGHRPPGRGLLGPDAVEVQLALPVDLVTAPAGPGAPVVPGRVEVVELPPDPPPPAPAAGAAAGVDVVLGPGGDDGAPVSVDLVRCGGLLVAGPPGSGRTTALAALGTRLSRAGTPVLQVGPATPVATVTDWAATGPVVPGPVVLDPVVPGHGVAGHRVVVVDDLGRLPDPLLDALTAITGPGRGVVLVAAATPADVAAAFRGPAPALRRSRTALLLQPGRGDAELLGLRLPRDQLPRRPGSGWLVTPAAVTRVQVARRG